MNHWLEVGADIWWALKWPIQCGLWVIVGSLMHTVVDDIVAASFILTALGVTVILAMGV